MSDPWSSRVLRDMQDITHGKLVAALGESQMHRAIAGVFPEPQPTNPMTDTILPLTEADVRAFGYTPFGYERDDRMGAVLAHRDGEAFYLCRRGAFWSIDPEYTNIRGVLCEEPPNWRQFRAGCEYAFMLSQNEMDGGNDVLGWRVSDLPVERAERLGNYHTIAPVLAGLKAQAEVGDLKDIANHPITKNRWETKNVDPKPVVEDLALPYEPVPEPAYRNPLKVGDRVCYTPFGTNDVVDGVVEATRTTLSDWAQSRQCRVGGKWHWEAGLFLILPGVEG